MSANTITPGKRAEAVICWERNNLTDDDLRKLSNLGVDIQSPYQVERHLANTVTWTEDELYSPGYFVGVPEDDDETRIGSRPALVNIVGFSPASFLADWSEWEDQIIEDIF